MSEKYTNRGSTVYENDEELSTIDVVDLLNEQQATISALKEENEQLKEERNYFERKKCEYFNKYNKKHLDNIQLKEENEHLRKKLEQIYGFKGLNCRCVR